jgi:hypothetical protein
MLVPSAIDRCVFPSPLAPTSSSEAADVTKLLSRVPQDDRTFEFWPGGKIKLFNGGSVRKSRLFYLAPQHVLLPGQQFFSEELFKAFGIAQITLCSLFNPALVNLSDTPQLECGQFLIQRFTHRRPPCSGSRKRAMLSRLAT